MPVATLPAIAWSGATALGYDDEYHWTGNYEGTRPSPLMNGAVSFRVRLSARRDWQHRARDWCFSVQILIRGAVHFLDLRGGPYRTLREARQAAADTVTAYEQSDRFAREFWPQATSWSRRRTIFRQVLGADRWVWVATTFASPPSLFRSGALGWGRFLVHEWHVSPRTDQWEEWWQEYDVGAYLSMSGKRTAEIPAALKIVIANHSGVVRSVIP